MVDYGNGISGFILNLISLIHSLFSSISSSLILIILIYYSYTHRLKQEEKTTLVLSIHIYILILIHSIILTSISIQTFIGDIYGRNFSSSSCIFQGYFLVVIGCSLYYAFDTQAFFRLCRIIYTRYRWLQLYWFYIINIPIQLILASVLLSPVLVLYDINYLPNDFYCFVSFRNIRGFLYVLFICYCLPLLSLLLIYIRITFYLRQQPTNLALSIKRKQERDLIAIRKIFIHVSLLLTVGLPGMILLIMSFINGVEHPLTYRIIWIGVEVSLAILSIEMVFTTPQLRDIVLKKVHANRITPIQGSIQLRPITTVQ